MAYIAIIKSINFHVQNDIPATQMILKGILKII